MVEGEEEGRDAKKVEMLRGEGIFVENGKVKDFENVMRRF